jgi:hypothetical protein
MPEAKKYPSGSHFPSQFKRKQPVGTVMVPLEFKGSYAVIAEGQCLGDLIRDGETIIISPSKKVEPGMIVALGFLDKRQSVIKRLVSPLFIAPGADDNIEHLLAVEMDNPKKRFFIKPSSLEFVHAVVGVMRDGEFVNIVPAPPVSGSTR